MTPEEMHNRIEELESRVIELEGAMNFHPETLKAIELLLTKDSGASVTDYDTGTFNAAAVYDGMLKIGTKMIGYYDEV